MKFAKFAQKCVFMISVLAFITLAAQAQSPAGEWSVNANGYTGYMFLNVDAAGNVTGTFFGNAIKGLWNPSTKRLVFYRALDGTTSYTPPEQIQVFTGYMFPQNASSPNGLQMMAGEFQFFAGTGGTGAVNILGWYAWSAATL